MNWIALLWRLLDSPAELGLRLRCLDQGLGRNPRQPASVASTGFEPMTTTGEPPRLITIQGPMLGEVFRGQTPMKSCSGETARAGSRSATLAVEKALCDRARRRGMDLSLRTSAASTARSSTESRSASVCWRTPIASGSARPSCCSMPSTSAQSAPASVQLHQTTRLRLDESMSLRRAWVRSTKARRGTCSRWCGSPRSAASAGITRAAGEAVIHSTRRRTRSTPSASICIRKGSSSNAALVTRNGAACWKPSETGGSTPARDLHVAKVDAGDGSPQRDLGRGRAAGTPGSATLVVPLILGHRVAGAIYLDPAGPFDNEDLQLLMPSRRSARWP